MTIIIYCFILIYERVNPIAAVRVRRVGKGREDERPQRGACRRCDRGAVVDSACEGRLALPGDSRRGDRLCRLDYHWAGRRLERRKGDHREIWQLPAHRSCWHGRLAARARLQHSVRDLARHRRRVHQRVAPVHELSPWAHLYRGCGGLAATCRPARHDRKACRYRDAPDRLDDRYPAPPPRAPLVQRVVSAERSLEPALSGEPSRPRPDFQGGGRDRRRAAPIRVRPEMAIIVNLDVMLAKRKMRSKELAERIGITEQNVSLLKS